MRNGFSTKNQQERENKNNFHRVQHFSSVNCNGREDQWSVQQKIQSNITTKHFISVSSLLRKSR
jgi:hypothetical protein